MEKKVTRMIPACRKSSQAIMMVPFQVCLFIKSKFRVHPNKPGNKGTGYLLAGSYRCTVVAFERRLAAKVAAVPRGIKPELVNSRRPLFLHDVSHLGPPRPAWGSRPLTENSTGSLGRDRFVTNRDTYRDCFPIRTPAVRTSGSLGTRL
ncbi:unnamed protein product, partial [Iphiclides podalirius]